MVKKCNFISVTCDDGSYHLNVDNILYFKKGNGPYTYIYTKGGRLDVYESVEEIYELLNKLTNKE